MFQGSFKDVLSKFQGCLKKVSSVLRKFHQKVPRCFKKVSNVFYTSFKKVSRGCQGCFKKVFNVFERSFVMHGTHRSYPSRKRAFSVWLHCDSYLFRLLVNVFQQIL